MDAAKRIEAVRDVVDSMLLEMNDAAERRCAYLHLYGVSQACALIACKRKENQELAVIAGMLHDIYTYSAMDSTEHGPRGAVLARTLLEKLGLFSAKKTEQICTAIFHHSDKGHVHTPFDEVLKDADVMQHVLYNPLMEIHAHEKQRFEQLAEEFHLEH